MTTTTDDWDGIERLGQGEAVPGHPHACARPGCAHGKPWHTPRTRNRKCERCDCPGWTEPARAARPATGSPSGSQPPPPAPAPTSMPGHLSEAASAALSAAEHQYEETPMPTPAPASPGGGAAVLARLRAALTRYVILPSPEAAVAVALWIAATHALPAWQHAPRLVIRAPEKRCGKSRLLDIIEATCHNPLITVNASPSAVYRSVGTNCPPTLLIDEADTIFGGSKADANEELRGLLNAGHQRNRPALRWDASTHAVDAIPTFAMAALAGIGAMPDTIEDRAVIIRMRRRAPGENVCPYRYRRDRPALSAIAADLADWLAGHLEGLEAAEPAMPLEDRAADTWEPLIAVADLAGSSWPALARAAALALTADHAACSQSERIRLLTDCRTAFGDADALPTKVLIEWLRADPEAPWCEPPPGLTPMRLGTLLAEYDIRSATIRFGEPWGRLKGYHRADFADAWTRYCDPPGPGPDPRAEGAPGDERHGSSRDTTQAVTPLTCNVTAVTAGTATPRRLSVINGGGAR